MKAVILRPALAKTKSIYADISYISPQNSVQRQRDVFASCLGHNITLREPQKLTEQSIVGARQRVHL